MNKLIKTLSFIMMISIVFNACKKDDTLTVEQITDPTEQKILDFKAKLNNFPRVFCCDTYHSQGLHGPFVPDHFVDLTKIWIKKMAAISAA